MFAVAPCYNGRTMPRSKRTEDTQRITADLPVSVYERLRLAVFKSRRNMWEILTDLIRDNITEDGEIIYRHGATPGDVIHERGADKA